MILQPENSNLCGQCCLGTVLNITLEDSIKLVGHKKSTRTNELTKHFKNGNTKLKKGFPTKYSLCKVYYKDKKPTHWVLWENNRVYDPNFGNIINYSEWFEIVSEYYATPRITSFIEI